MEMTPEQRQLRSSAASATRWSSVADKTEEMRPALSGFLARFEREVDEMDPEGLLPDHVRARLVEEKKNAYMKTLALKSSRARQARRASRRQPNAA